MRSDLILSAKDNSSIKLEKSEMNFLSQVKMREASELRDGGDSDIDGDISDASSSPAKKARKEDDSRTSMYRFFMEMKEMGNTVSPKFRNAKAEQI